MYAQKNPLCLGISFMRVLLMLAAFQSSLVAQTPPPLPQLATGADESVFATIQETYYVSPDGNDINPGTLSLPFKTFSVGINKAVERKNAGINVKIILRNGTYREKKTLAAAVNASNNACIIIEAENKGEVIISGSVDWSGQWVEDGSNWTHSWTFNWGVAPSYSQIKNELGRRREMFFVNKVLYTQVLSQTKLTEGTYYVDETGDKAYIRPLSGVDIATALIEVGMLEKVFTITPNQKNIAIKGLSFQHDASFPVGAGGGEGVFRVGKDCSNILLQDLSIEWNNGAGLGALDASDFRQNFTFRRVKINNNGGGGFSFGNSQNLLFEDCETSYNRFRGKWAGQVIGASPGGFKLASTHRTSFIRHKAIGNYGRGMWWDIANRDMTAKDCYIDENYGSGMFVEFNFGPALIENCTIINTNKANDYTLRNQGGMQFASTANLTIQNCTIKNNVQSQIKCWDQQRTMTDHLTGEVKRYDKTNVGNVYLHGNTVEATDTTQSLIDIPDWPYLISTWISNNNTYIHRKKSAAFRVYPGGTEDGDNAGDANYFLATNYTFEEWKNLINGDAESIFIGPPGVSIVSPENNAVFSACQPVTLRAEPSNFESSIISITFYKEGNQLIGEDADSTNGWQITLEKPAAGDYAVTAIARDSANAAVVSDTLFITIQPDTIAPVITSSAYITVNADAGLCSANVTIANAAATDNCSVSVVSGQRSDNLALDAAYSAGTTTIIWTAADSAGNTSEAIQTITVKDIEAPLITVKPNPAEIWPPNNKYVTYTMADMVQSITDQCEGNIALERAQINSVSFNSDKKSKKPGKPQYIIASDKKSVQLMASKNEKGNDRKYVVYLSVSDTSGNTGTADFKAVVPHDQGRRISTLSSKGLTISVEKTAALKVYPNPSKGNFTLQFNAEKRGRSVLTISDAGGRNITSVSIPVNEGLNTIPLNNFSLAPNVYVIRLKVDGKVLSMKLMLAE